MQDNNGPSQNSFTQFYREFIFSQRWVLLGLAFLGLVTLGTIAFNVLITADTWGRFSSLQFDSTMQTGRWMKALIWKLLDEPIIAPAATLAVYFALASLAWVVIAQLLGAKKQIEVFLFASLGLFSPVMAVRYLLPSFHLSDGIAFVLVGIFLYLAQDTIINDRANKRARLVAAVACITFATGIRQAFFLQSSVFAAAAILHNLIRQIEAGTFSWRNVRLNFLTYGGILFGAAAAYLAVCKIVLLSFGLEYLEGYYYPNLVSNKSELAIVLLRAFDYFRAFLLFPQHLWPGVVKLLFLILLLSMLFLLWKRVISLNTKTLRILGVSSIAILVIGILLSPWAFGLILVNPQVYRYTGILGLSAVYPVVFLQAAQMGRSVRAGPVCSVLAGAIVLLFAINQNTASTTVMLSNQRDLMVAQRILTRIETREEFKEFISHNTRKIILYGSIPSRKAPPFNQYARSPMGTSLVNSTVFGNHTYQIVFPNVLKLIEYEAIHMRQRGVKLGLTAGCAPFSKNVRRMSRTGTERSSYSV